jgi:hypothetical protein
MEGVLDAATGNGLFDFHDSVAVFNKIGDLLQYLLYCYTELYHPRSALMVNYLYIAIVELCIEEWKTVADMKHVIDLEQVYCIIKVW